MGDEGQGDRAARRAAALRANLRRRKSWQRDQSKPAKDEIAAEPDKGAADGSDQD
ncbi:MAG: hypothetical protein KI792_07465 [Alphaproteobacteria bacterium]|nr:hypothetical protein [Alphaproteobacteria bacterium SS10]